jgi:hypothetical protein
MIKNKIMITTLDGKEKKRGEWVWEVGWCGTPGLHGYVPSRGQVHKWNLTRPDKCWEDYLLCLQECIRLNTEMAYQPIINNL